MIQANMTGQAFFSFRGAQSLSSVLPSGSVVRAEILGSEGGSGTRVRIAGLTFTADGTDSFKAGEILDVKIRYSGNTVFLHRVNPSPASVPSNVFTRLGIPETGISTYIISFFQKINARLDERTINQVLRLSTRFPGKEKRAAEAASILAERGIEPLFGTVSLLVDALEGKLSDNDRDFLAFINQKKTHERHWVILPYKRSIDGTSYTGSIRFLLDTGSLTVIETKITFWEENRCWDFELEKNRCRFTADPPFKTVNFEKFGVYLRGLLSESGIGEVSSYIRGFGQESVPNPIDLEV